MTDRAQIIDENFIRRVGNADFPPPACGLSLAESGLSGDQLLQLFRAQLYSRQLDLVARRLQAQGVGFYTIGSAGHEGMAAIALAFRDDDMAFLHYRDAAFFIQRHQQHFGSPPLNELLHSFCASSADPISGGRHKVLGSKAMLIPPQTSTIASQLPKAVGAAYSIPLAKRMDHRGRLARDGVILCSFGDASVNHSSAQGAINFAAWTAYQQLPLPLVLICEDNGLGISTPTPGGWIEASSRRWPNLHYLACNGLDLLDTYRTACQAAALARHRHQPVFLHLKLVRLLGHAGADAEIAYRKQQQIEADEARDPLLHSARELVEQQRMSPAQLVDLYRDCAREVAQAAAACKDFRHLESAEAVMASLIPPHAECPRPPATEPPRDSLFADQQQALKQPQPLARLLNWTLTDLMRDYPQMVLAGQDIGAKGGVYHVTARLQKLFGRHRVLDTLLDEQSILGLAIGLAHNGLLPVVEIQFLAYVHNAEDQIRGEAATLSFFSNGQFANPMVVRIASFGYQKGFGGHFHNDNSIALFRDIPGLILVCPSNGLDAMGLLREAVRLAHEEQRVVIFLEPIALYMTRDLQDADDGGWSHEYCAPDRCRPIAFGEIGQYREGTQLALVSYGNGYYLCRRAAAALQRQGIQLRLIDLRWLAPLPEAQLLEAVQPCEHVLIVDECRRSGSLSEALITLLAERGYRGKFSRLTAEDSFIALGPAATATLPSVESIVQASLALLER